MGGVGISKVANLLKSLDSEIGDPEFNSGPGSEDMDDKIGISFIMTQPDCRSPARSGTRQNDFVGLAGGGGTGRAGWRTCPTSFLAEMSLINEKMPIRPLWLII
jgi:hypothetical protein